MQFEQNLEAFLKGENNMGPDLWKTFLEKNQVKVGVDLAADKICDATVKGENEMNIKETLNKIYGKPAATNEPIKDDIGVDKTFEELLMPKTEEEYIWVKGFKGTDKNMQCTGNYQYELGKQFDLDEDVEPSVCHNGFHFCKELVNVFKHYRIGAGNRFFEVEALVKKSDFESVNDNTHTSYASYYYTLYSSKSIPEDKYAAKSIRFIRELTPDEVFDAFCDGGSDVCKWDEIQKKRAMATSIQMVRAEIRVDELIEAGYSPAFAQYISDNTDRYKTALAVASLPDVSMDVKVMAIFMDNDN